MTRALCFALLAACSKGGASASAGVNKVTIKGTVTNILAPGTTSSQLATSFSDCAPKLRVRIFDGVSILLNASTAKALGACDVGADGAFACLDIDISEDYASLYTVIDNQPGTTACAAPTVQELTPCGFSQLKDSSNTACGGGRVLTDNVLDSADNVLVPQYVVPKSAVAAFDTQLASATPALSQTVTGKFAPLEQTGWLIARVLASGTPAANAKPFAPVICGATDSASQVAYDCRAYAIEATNTFQLSSAPLTTASGLWIAQVQATLNGGAPQQPPFDLAAYADKPGTYGAIDCGGGAPVTCYRSAPQGTFVAGVLFDEAPVSIVTISTDTPVSAASGSACPFALGVSAVARPGTLSCP